MENNSKNISHCQQTEMNRAGDKCLIKSPDHTLYLFHLAENRYTSILPPNASLRFFSFLGRQDSSILTTFKSRKIKILSQNGALLQTLDSEEKTILGVQVGVGRKIFMIRNKQGLSLYRLDAKRKNFWNLWKKMFTQTSDSILNANLLSSDSEVLVLFKSLELSVYSIENREKKVSYQLPLSCVSARTLFPLPQQKSLFMDTPRKNFLLLNFDECVVQNFQIHFADLLILKSVQILTAFERIVFLNDSNQILFCKFGEKKRKSGDLISDGSPGKIISSFDRLVVEMSLNFGAEENVRDFAVNSLGNVVLVYFENGTCRFLDIDILKQNYGKKQSSFAIDGTKEKLIRLPCDALSRDSGLISTSTFKKSSQFKSKFFHKSLHPEKENQKQNFLKKNSLPKQTKLVDFLFSNPQKIKKKNGLTSALCDENKEPQYGLSKLRAFLRRFGGFPDETRGAIWGYLLGLPGKKRAYEQLKFLGEYKGKSNFEEEKHLKSIRAQLDQWKSQWNPKKECSWQPARDIKLKTESKSSNLTLRFNSLRHSLSHYHHFFNNNPISDQVLFAFTKLFQQQESLAFELTLSFFFRWGSPLMSNFPNLPIQIEDQTQILLREHNPKLPDLVSALPLIEKLWESLGSLFTNIFSRKTWLHVFDFLFAFSDFPELFYLIIPAVIIEFEEDILAFGRNHEIIRDEEVNDASGTIDPLSQFLDEAESFLQETGHLENQKTTDIKTDEKIDKSQSEIWKKCNNVSKKSKIDDSKILARTQAAEELVFEDKIAHLDKQIDLRLKARSPILILKKNAFVSEIIEKAGRLKAQNILRRVNLLLKTAYQKELLVLRFKDFGKLDGGGSLRYPIFPFMNMQSPNN